MNRVVEQVTEQIIARSRPYRQAYLRRIELAADSGPVRSRLPMSNLAHDLAACPAACRERLLAPDAANIGIISAYNDLVSAHQPYGEYSGLLKEAVQEKDGAAQVAAGVPAMCDGVTQGEPGMELSLISRDVIAMATVIGLSHNVFDGALLLGVCDKIVPGLLMGGLQFGHLPMLLVPAGPMRPGIANREKALARQRYAQGEISRDEMLAIELKAYHSPGTCTFYGTANSNQLMAEMLGLHLPGASFVNAGTRLRQALTRAAGHRICAITHLGGEYTPIGRVVSEKSVVNAMVGLLATGGSTNETMHLVAIARAAGIHINWDDFALLSDNVPLLVRIYPNGPGDINSFQGAGGMALLIRELLAGGFAHADVLTVAGPGLDRYTAEPALAGEEASWRPGPDEARDAAVIAPLADPFAPMGGIKVLSGNLGRAIMKISALTRGDATLVEAPALVFAGQHELEAAFHQGRLDRDLVAVVRFQGPRANGMPELHKLITYLSIAMDRGHSVGLVTDGRLSGASGKVPFAIHCTPEAADGGLLARVEDGDLIRMDARNGALELLVDEEELAARIPARPPAMPEDEFDLGRHIFAPLRRHLAGAEQGGSSIFAVEDDR